MIYTELTKKAMGFAYRAHHGQTDPTGVPYIFHPIHLAEQMDDEISTCAALLHDVVEDTPVTLEELAGEFPPEVVQTVALLTHDESMDYLDYVRALRDHPVARKIKLADLAHNSDVSRWAGVSHETKEKLSRHLERYAHAKAILEGAEW